MGVKLLKVIQRSEGLVVVPRAMASPLSASLPGDFQPPEPYSRYFAFLQGFPIGWSHPGVLDVRGRRDFTLADLTLARGGPTLATLVRAQSEDLFVRALKAPFLAALMQ